MASSRHDGDTWDLASSVGATATMAAAARAMATRVDPAFIDDRFAEPLVRAVGVDLLTRLASGEAAPGELVEPVWLDLAKVRTKFYDEFFRAAALSQIVILAAGLDSRAYRLPWPAGTVVYEVDRPEVLEFKTRTLAGLGAEPTADRRVVAADLREDWPAALRAAGFDPARPTAWSAEGLLGYLPPEAQDRLLDTVTELSAPGSRVATENRPNPRPGDEARTKEGLDRLSGRWRGQGFDTDMARLRYFGERNEAAPYLAAHGWELTGSTVRELLAAHGLAPLGDDDLRMGDVRYVSGVLPPVPRPA
ncbi:class I SAM-dependent methyltransferase [Amycolatopsis sp. DG1A-15b]|uniref:class I SAM-dependent methyltransferase n=1 Tax=Amycolatopsis sp. DG1A-15b TaxID=3052846 RepID=UPI00255B6CD8|nr:class I SAM-dependent methyltransferase [Amycolatopsis sp. DG1A-15b]WIX84846.1 class I SAM-dependent methyltransferase [Amycolatopsis sp. DG1A-15b]